MNGSATIAESCAFLALLARGVAQKRVSESQTLQSFGALSRRGTNPRISRFFTADARSEAVALPPDPAFDGRANCFLESGRPVRE
jgi:hypothetical protein